MEMSDPDRIDMVHPLSDQLQAELGRGIDQEISLRQTQQGTVPGASIPGIPRGAPGAMAPDDGNAEGGSCAEKCELHAALLTNSRPQPSRGVDSGAVSWHRMDLESGMRRRVALRATARLLARSAPCPAVRAAAVTEAAFESEETVAGPAGGHEPGPGMQRTAALLHPSSPFQKWLSIVLHF